MRGVYRGDVLPYSVLRLYKDLFYRIRLAIHLEVPSSLTLYKMYHHSSSDITVLTKLRPPYNGL
jgi:hypothetical protein